MTSPCCFLKMYGALRVSQSLADLTSDSTQRHHGPGVMQRSGSSAALLDVPAAAASRAAPKGTSSPNLTLAAMISRAELSKLHRFGAGEREDGSYRTQNSSGRATPDLNRSGGSHASLNAVGTDISPVASTSPPVDYEEVRGQFFEPSSRSAGEAASRSAHSSVRSGLNVSVGQDVSTAASADRSRANSFPEDVLTGAGSDSSCRAAPSHCDDGSGFRNTGSGLRRGSDDTGLQGSRTVYASPSLPQLLEGRQRLRPPDHRGQCPSLAHSGSEVSNPSAQRPPTDPANHSGQRLCRSLADVTAAGSATGAPPLPPPRPSRALSKRLSVPNILEAGGEEPRRELAFSQLYRRRMTAGDVMETVPSHNRSSSGNLSMDSFAGSSSRQSLDGCASSHRTPPPPPPLPDSVSASTSTGSSFSPRRAALDTLIVTDSSGSNNSDSGNSSHATISSYIPSGSSRGRSASSVPVISVTDHEGAGPHHSPQSDYPLNDLSPTSTSPCPQGLGPQPPASSGGHSDRHIYKTVSETTCTSYNIKGEGGLDDTRSTNTEGGPEEGVTQEDPASW